MLFIKGHPAKQSDDSFVPDKSDFYCVLKTGGESGKMLKRLKRSYNCWKPISAHCGLSLVAASAILLLLLQSGCFFHKKGKAPVPTIGPVRIVLLPFNVPSDNTDLRWVALAAPILMAKVSEQAPDLVVIPFWEAMPTIIQSGGASRSFTQETAASVAAWLTAKWASLGDISPVKARAAKPRTSKADTSDGGVTYTPPPKTGGLYMMVDFIPSKSNLVPFRYQKTGSIDALGSSFHEAYRQLLRYLVARPLQPAKSNLPSMTSMKTLAEALDREYGWFVDADPGKAQEVVADLARTDERLARLLFNPSVYPILGQPNK